MNDPARFWLICIISVLLVIALVIVGHNLYGTYQVYRADVATTFHKG